MIPHTITAHFASSEQLNSALSSLRQAGALDHTGDLPWAGVAGGVTVHLSIPPSRTVQVQDILRRSGGRL